MALDEPDRVPVFCQLAIGHYFLHASSPPFDIWYRSDAFADALVELQRRYRYDGILVNLPGRDPDFERNVVRIEERPHEMVVWWKSGGRTRMPSDDNPHYLEPGGTRAVPRLADVDPELLWYVEPWDLRGITYPHIRGFDVEPPPLDDFFPPYHLDTIAAVQQKTAGEVSIHAEVFSPFSQFLELLDYQYALLALLEDPSKVHACLERLTAGAIDLACRQAAVGVDAVLISSAFAGGGFISREHYREFVLPYERRLIDQVKSRHPDVTLYTHTCGAIGDRLELMLETGTQGIDTLDPPPLGTVALEEAVPVLEGRAFIKGNIDPVNTLLHGDATRSARLCGTGCAWHSLAAAIS